MSITSFMDVLKMEIFHIENFLLRPLFDGATWRERMDDFGSTSDPNIEMRRCENILLPAFALFCNIFSLESIIFLTSSFKKRFTESTTKPLTLIAQ